MLILSNIEGVFQGIYKINLFSWIGDSMEIKVVLNRICVVCPLQRWQSSISILFCVYCRSKYLHL